MIFHLNGLGDYLNVCSATVVCINSAAASLAAKTSRLMKSNVMVGVCVQRCIRLVSMKDGKMSGTAHDLARCTIHIISFDMYSKVYLWGKCLPILTYYKTAELSSDGSAIEQQLTAPLQRRSTPQHISIFAPRPMLHILHLRA